MSYERITKFTSPNYTPRSKVLGIYGLLRRISGITIHHWGDPRGNSTFSGVVSWLCNPKSNVSAHAVIEAGKVAYLVNYSDVAWHAGSGKGNATTIGLELHPRASEGDYATAAEHIADIWVAYGKIPLYPHSAWKATKCPGAWDLKKLGNLAEKYYADKTKRKATVPSTGTAVALHTVKKGDTLSKLSEQYGTTVAAIVKQNKIKDPDKIYVGQKLRIKIG